MRSILFALVLAAATLPAAAQMPCRDNVGIPEPAAPGEEPQSGHFYRIPGKGLACAVDNAEGEAMSQHKQAISFLPCLRVGAVGIADGRGTVESLLGAPSQISDIDLRTQARVYPIHQRSVPEPYYVVTYLDNVAVAVQLIGPPTEMPATFSGLALGESAQAVTAALGKPTRRCMMRHKGPETWTWHPFPIGVDILDDRVVGFKVTWPAGRPTPD